MSEIAYGRTKNRSLLGTLNDFSFGAHLRFVATRLPGRHRAATGRNAHHAAGRRLSDRPDPRAVLSVNAGCLWTDCRRSDLRLFGSAWARQDFPSALRGLDPPSALPWSCHYRSDETADRDATTRICVVSPAASCRHFETTFPIAAAIARSRRVQLEVSATSSASASEAVLSSSLIAVVKMRGLTSTAPD